MRIAFLRGINVGGHNVSKTVLCDVLSGLGLTDVRTFIASGNLLFEGADSRAGGDVAKVDARLEDDIAAALEARLGWPVPTFVRSPAEVAAVAACRAVAELAPAEDETLQVGFRHQSLEVDQLAEIEALATPTDELRVEGRELYWLCRGPVHRSKLTGSKVERVGGGPVTFRNIKTVIRLVQLLGHPQQ